MNLSWHVPWRQSETAKGDTAEFLLLTSDDRLTADALAPLGRDVSLAPVVVVEVDNRPGTLAVIARRLAEASINVTQDPWHLQRRAHHDPRSSHHRRDQGGRPPARPVIQAGNRREHP